MDLIVFNDTESGIIDRCQRVVKDREMNEAYDRIVSNINALIELSRAISQYPSILKSNDLGDNMRSVDSLIEMLCQKQGFDKTLHIPTKAVLGKGFLVAKINFFQMIRFLANPIPELRNESIEINTIVSEIVFTLMSEEVFISIIEEPEQDETIRTRAAFLLANIWEYRLNQNVRDFAPILNSIWEARKKLQPVFGTMMGTVEMMALSAELEKPWSDFVSFSSGMEEITQALEEFLFTLSYEELYEIREKMKELNLRCITKKDLPSILEKNLSYPEFGENDTRDMYVFYRSRKHNAKFRKRAEKNGPKMTIEEYIMSHLLSQPEWVVNL